MKIKLTLLFLIAISAAGVFAGQAKADGIIIPQPPICEPGPCPPRHIPISQLVIRYHWVDITIHDQIAITHIDQVFYNPNDWTVEGTYVFPIPKNAVVSGFTLWIDGEPVDGEVLDADQARKTYEDIVRQMKDPALLEYADQGAVQARIFPIPPGGERRIELEYSEVLSADNGLVRYVYPLNTEKFSVRPLENVRVSLDIRSSTRIRAVYSPSHPVSISRESDYLVGVGYEENDVLPNMDFILYYSLGEEEAFHLLSYRDPSDPTNTDGFFLLLLAPRPNASQRVIPKDVIIVLDRSGSMEGEKFSQAQEALGYILRHLNPEDRFNVIAFSTGIDTYASGLRSVADTNEAKSWVDRLSAIGSTDINRALLEAVSMAGVERPTYLIFLTDGLPTEGVVESQKILDNLVYGTPDNLRLFSFGVGYDVDTFLLDSLAQEHHGTSTYVLPGESLEEILSTFYSKISTPVLTDLQLKFNGVTVYDIYPSPLPDFFIGSQIVVVGRYREGAIAEVVLSGEMNNVRETFVFPEQVFDQDSREEDIVLDALPRLWATRKIGHLLNNIRLNGPDQETIDQIVRLSIRYGIVTPYTSYLVTEPMPLGAAEQERIARDEFDQKEAMPAPSVSGQDAVERAADMGAMQEVENVLAPPVEAADIIRIVGSKTFVQYDGVWVDTTFDPDLMDTLKVAFLSEDYFNLAEANQELATAFSLGINVIALSNGVVYEVVPSDSPADSIDLIPTSVSIAPTDIPIKPTLPSETTGIAPQVTPGPISIPPSSPSSKSPIPCLGGMLPLIIFSLGLILINPSRNKYH